MKLDCTLAKEIRAVNGDGSREARFRFLKKLDAAKKDFSSVDVMETFGESLKRHGRAATAICVAVTLWERRERLEGWRLSWAKAVLNLWTNCSPSNYNRAYIDDGLHPSRICEYAASFIRMNTEEE